MLALDVDGAVAPTTRWVLRGMPRIWPWRLKSAKGSLILAQDRLLEEIEASLLLGELWKIQESMHLLKAAGHPSSLYLLEETATQSM